MQAAILPLLVAAAVSAPDAHSGISASVRAGYGIPLGRVSNASGAELSRVYVGTLPLWGDLGWRFNEHLVASAYLQWGLGLINDASLSANSSASGSDVLIGLQATWSLTPERPVSPWVGVGAGYEWANFFERTDTFLGALEFSTQNRGFQLMLQAGADWRHETWPPLGPFLTVVIGEFQTSQLTSGGVTVTQDVTNPPVHVWVQLGVRGAFDVPVPGATTARR
ncbi:MAG TPA: hypothetical protein VND93_23205 [Myxococcales bacterium]|nr:hypothetical protein [Myxococcales bacterium]